ncbi:MAG: pilus assembly protein TadG-related protein [Alcanivorax sp.]|uniref:pilus assembly protein TadG-related protein n=1 Tax=Alcanivorax sp. TaxID=1872427 RepID=UPI003DA7A070
MMKRQQRGAYMVMMAILIVILIGVAALAIDVGRVLMMRTDMQNAADAAALAAAAELDSSNNAQARARAAARDLLEHDARFARVTELLGSTGLPDEAFEFFCVIGSENDIEPGSSAFAAACSGSEVEPGKYAATSDDDTHYVRVTLDPGLVGDGDRFTSDLIFLPVLGAVGVDVRSVATAFARALAGKTFFTCNFPPLVICDPWEDDGSNFRDEMPVGAHIELKHQKNSWAPGQFGFLQSPSGPGASSLQEYLANPDLAGCNPPIVTTEPGNKAQPGRRGINVRFDIYEGPLKNSHDEFPPAPNIIEYPIDQTTQATDSRLGTGDWNFEDYWNTEHSGAPIPNGWNNASPPLRWDVYNHEISNGIIPLTPSHAPGPPSRRLLNVAVLSCTNLGVAGRVTVPVFPKDGFAKIFLLDQANSPGGPNGLQFHGEFLGWVDGVDNDYHVQIQLYE